MAVTVLTSVPVSAHLAVLGLWGQRFQLFLTVAGMVAVITAVLAGAATGVLAAASDRSLAISLAAGALTGLVVLTDLTRLQSIAWRRGRCIALRGPQTARMNAGPTRQ